MAQLKAKHEGQGWWTLAYGEEVVLQLDPALPRKGRHEAPPADFVLLTEGDDATLEDALDLLEAHPDAMLVASPEVCAEAARLQELPPERFMDLKPWGRARGAHLRITAVPLRIPQRTGLPVPGIEAVQRLMPRLGGLEAALRPPFASARDILGYLLTFQEELRVLFVSAAFAGRAEVELLKEIATRSQVDLLIAAVEGSSVEGLIWATRILEPRAVLLYRRDDPYALGAADQNLPIRYFIDALAEDDPELEVEVLGEGDSWTSPGVGAA